MTNMLSHRFFSVLIFCLTIVLITGSSSYGIKDEENSNLIFLNITIPNPIREEKDGKVFYRIDGFRYTIQEDMPMLPAKRYFLEIPNDAKNIKVRLIDSDSESLGIIKNIALSKPISISTNFNKSSVKSSLKYSQILSEFPSEVFSLDGIVQVGNNKLASISVYPLQYNMNTGELTFYNNISIAVEYNSKNKIKELIEDFSAEKISEMMHRASEIDQVRYVIITDPSLESALHPLKEWKTKKGILAEIYTTEFIYQNYPYTENFVFYSGNGHDLNNFMQISINLTDVSTANMSFSTKYNIEYGWDFGYIEASTNGENWTHLSGRFMSDYRESDAYVGDENVSSYTGNATWITDVIDLDNYTGNFTYLRFRYVTDTYVALDGWFIDNITINTDKGILLYDNGTGSGNWTFSGFRIIREQTESESIREFIRDKADNGAEWILLAGDINKVPTRYVQRVWNSDPFDNESFPTDYYYTALNGTWDSEWLTDIPDVYVGRLPTSNLSEIQSMVSKIINYERNPAMNNSQWFQRAVLAGGVSDEETDEAYLMEVIRKNIIPENFNVTRLYYSDNYEKEYDLNYDNFETQTGIGEFMVNWGGHGSHYSASVSIDGVEFVDTKTNPENDAMLPLVYADSCLTGAFDQENCLGEVVLKNWGISYIGASSSSYYTENWKLGDGFNQELNYRFWEQFFDGNYKPGEALYNSKIWYIMNQLPNDILIGEYASRKNLITYNLLGDPEIPIWTSFPENFTVEFPKEIYTGNDSITITVKNSSNCPLENAVVCIQGSGIYNYGSTNSSGEIRFNLRNLSVGRINVTVTKHNFLPYEGNISVIISGTIPEGQALNVTLSQTTMYAGTTYNVTVIVTNQSSGANVSGANVSASGAGITPVSALTVNGTATLEMTPTEAGTITVTVNKTGYLGTVGDTTITVRLHEFESVTPSITEMIVNAVYDITVTVLDAIEGVLVTLTGCGVSTSGTTNASGIVTFTNITANVTGNITVTASNKYYSNKTATISVVTTTTTTTSTTTTSTTTTSTTTTTTLPVCKGDANGDGVVDDFELLDYIDKWAKGLVPDFDLLEAIENWANRS